MTNEVIGCPAANRRAAGWAAKNVVSGAKKPTNRGATVPDINAQFKFPYPLDRPATNAPSKDDAAGPEAEANEANAAPRVSPVERGVTHDAPATVDATLQRILCWKRPFESKAEIEFMTWLHGELLGRGATYEVMAKGNVVVAVPRPDGKPVTTLFSCHTDTVHASAAPSDQQKLLYDTSFGHIFLDREDPDGGSCLGADDGAGVWIMLEMIKAKVPGTYVFHRGEEVGAVGAKALLEASPGWLSSFEAAVAFDRAGVDEVITHQGTLRCASDKYGRALALALNAAGGFHYATSVRGMFTDTKIYRKVIAECVNIGVGYANQHGRQETLDYVHLLALRDAVIKVNWDALPVDRNPDLADPPLPTPPQKKYAAYDVWDHGRHDFDTYKAMKKGKKKPVVKPPTSPHFDASTPALMPEDEFRMNVDDLAALFEDSPREMAELVIDLAAETAALRCKVEFLKGTLR